MPNLGELAIEACSSTFHKHCVEVRGLKEDDLTDSQMFVDLEQWTLTLLK
jgi:hypothetical protein